MHRTICLIQKLSLLALILFSSHTVFSQRIMYWVGGSGSWNDPTQVHWSKESGTLVATSELPDYETTVIFDSGSGLTSGKRITIPPGEWEAADFLIEPSVVFEIRFDGSSGNLAAMNIHGDLSLQSTSNVVYSDASVSHNVWRFVGTNDQNIETGNQDLSSVELKNAGTTYNQLSNLKALQQIRMFGGTWNSNGFNVNAGKILISDGIPSNGNHLAKTFNTGTSKILCEEWDSRLTYGSFTIDGDHIIYAGNFEGSPTQNGNQMSIHSLHLLEYRDNPINGESSVVDHNNFECTGCQIDTMVIEDTGRAKLAGTFTVEKKLQVIHPETTVEFNDGNTRSNEIFINGVVLTPKITGCLKRTIFKNSYDDITSFLRTSGTLRINDAVLVGIQASGGADFDLSGGVLQGSSSGWNIINAPNPTDYEWIGTVSVEDWDDPTKWRVIDGGSNGCLPSIVDNVYITKFSEGDIRIPGNFTAQCNNLVWDNEKELTLVLDGTTTLKSTLEVGGDFILDQTARISPVDRHEIIFSSVDDNTISTGPVNLPDIRFIGDEGEWSLQANLICDKIVFESGTFNTQDQGVLTEEWLSITQNPKHYDFARSRIKVNGEFLLSANTSSGVTVDPGASLVECEKLVSTIIALHDVQLNNTSNELLQNYPYIFNDLILNGSGEVSTQNDLTLNNLVYMQAGSALVIDDDHLLMIQEGISSEASAGSPGVLKSTTAGSQAEIDKASGNICVDGPVVITDINASFSGVFHAPQGTDGGNNSPNMNFASNVNSAALYWVGSTDHGWHKSENWSQTDGGCPSTKNPDDAIELIFNEHSFSTTPVSVSIPLGIEASNVYFLNAENLTIDVQANSTMGTIHASGYVNFVGNKSLDIGTTTLQSGAFMTTDMINFRTEDVTGDGGRLIVKSGSTAKINGL